MPIIRNQPRKKRYTHAVRKCVCDVSGLLIGFPYPKTFNLGGIPSNSHRSVETVASATKEGSNHER